jgi:threonyl-tRNA synthetase
MYKTSGHLPYYAESMFPPMELKEEDSDKPSEKIYLKAMNCPHHHKIFSAVPRSYRELPLRLAEYGTCYRYERSGELMGLMRVRSMQMNDAHIYCTADQFADEFRAVNEMYLKYFKIFGFDKFNMRFSTHSSERLGDKYVNEPDLWKQTEDMVRNVLVESGVDFAEVPDEAAFYGPKIDVQVYSISGREFTIATNQVDFAVPKRFGLEYKTRDNKPEIPLCIHRAPLGTHERFIAFLIEHYAGNFPLWLAPQQVRVLPFGEDQINFAKNTVTRLRKNGVRTSIDTTSDKIGARIRRAETEKVHTILLIGKREQESNSLAVREHGKGDLGSKPKEEVIGTLLERIQTREG